MKRIVIMLLDFAAFVHAVWKVTRDSELQLLAMSMSFITTISIVPFVAVLLSVAKIYGNLGQWMEYLKPLIFEYLATGAGQKMVHGLQNSVDRMNSVTLGSLGGLLLLIGALKILSQIDKMIQKIWGKTKLRSRGYRWSIYFGIILLSPLMLSILIGILSSPYITEIDWISSKVLISLVVWIVLYSIYKLVPNCVVHHRYALFASFVATIGYYFGQATYIWITKNVLHYNKINGSLVSVPLLLIWILVVWDIFLMGVALTSALQHKYG